MDTNTEWQASLERELALLQKSRDELKDRLRLAEQDARKEWNKLEATFQRVESELRATAGQTKRPLRELYGSARGLVDELKRGYQRMRVELRKG